MKLVLKFTYLSLFFIFGVACSNVTNDLEKAELVVESEPDSAMNILNKYEYNTINNEQKALFGLIFIQIHDKKHLEIVHDKILKTSTDFYEERGDNKHLAYCYFYTGRMYKYRLQYDKAMTYYLRALDCCSSKDYFVLGRINSDIGDVFVYQKNYTEAIRKYDVAYKNFSNTAYSRYAYNTLINSGRSYTFLKNYNKAQENFNKVIRETKDSLLLNYAYQSSGINSFHKKDYIQAIKLLKTALNYPYFKQNRAIQTYFLSDSYYELNNLDSSSIYANLTFNYSPDIVTKRECYRILTNIYYQKNDVSNIKKYLSLYQDFSDSLRKIDNQPKGKEIEQVYLSQKKATSSQSRVWFLIVSIIFICMSGIWLYLTISKTNTKKIKDIEIKNIQEKKETIQDILDRKKETLHNLIKEKKELVNIKGKLKSGMSMNELLMLYYDEFIHLSNSDYFKKEMNATLNGLYSKLENIYPDLREKEIQWACLSVLRFPNDEIMILLDYNSEAFKKMKQRFARKINAGSVANIDSALRELMYSM